MPFPTPNGERTYQDYNGVPLAGGQVFSYITGTTSPYTTYADEGMTVPNPNPITLDQAGRCVMWTDGLNRQVVYDMFGNLIWDQTTGIEIDSIPGNLTVGGNLTVDGNSQFNGSGNFSGPLSAQDGLGVNGGATINGGETVSGGLNTDNINNSGNISTNTLGANGITDNGDLSVAGNANVGGTLTVTGPSDLNGGVNTSSLNDSGNATIGGDLTVGGNEQVDGNLHVNGTITSGGGTGTPQPTPTIIPVRIAQMSNGGTDNVSTTDGLVVYEFDPTQEFINFTLQLPSGAPTGLTVVTKIGLLVYESQTVVGSTTGGNINWLPASGGTIDGMTFSPPVAGGATLPYNYQGVAAGIDFSFTNIGGDNWVVGANA